MIGNHSAKPEKDSNPVLQEQDVNRKDRMNKRDIWLITGLLVLAGIFYLVLNRIRITVNGKKFGTYSLDKNREIKVESETGYNVVIIEDGKAYVRDADCPDKYCVKMGKISGNSESLVCLPHKMIVEVEIGETGNDGSEWKSIPLQIRMILMFSLPIFLIAHTGMVSVHRNHENRRENKCQRK